MLNVNEILADVEKLLRRVIGEHIELDFQADAKAGNVRVDPTHLEQVIINLATNARDAMPEGGKLTMATTNVNLDDFGGGRRRLIARSYLGVSSRLWLQSDARAVARGVLNR
ncbi:MAG: hypothetical protein DMG38_10325 [Acidobacteria bacterium]|nr:MAG: hypothetical protein DMG38_10325 [Acidobacteriota bacterium]